MSSVVLSPRDTLLFTEIARLISPTTHKVRWTIVQVCLWNDIGMRCETTNQVLKRLESQGIVEIERPNRTRTSTWVVRVQPVEKMTCPHCDRMVEWSCLSETQDSDDLRRTRLPVPMGTVRCSVGFSSTVDLNGPSCDWSGLPVARINNQVFVVLHPKSNLKFVSRGS